MSSVGSSGGRYPGFLVGLQFQLGGLEFNRRWFTSCSFSQIHLGEIDWSLWWGQFVPEPIEDDAFCNGDVAKISPNSARLLLKPVVPTFAILFDEAEISACEPFNPVRAV